MKNYVFKLLKKYDYDWQKIYAAIKKREFVKDEEVEAYDNYQDFFSITDEDYPDQLKWTETPPFSLFYKGKRDIFQKLKYATLVHGGDSLTKYGKQLCESIVKKCKDLNNILIVCSWSYVGEYCLEIARKLSVETLIILSHGRNFLPKASNDNYVTLFMDDEIDNKKRRKQSSWLAAALCYRCIIPEIEVNKTKISLIDDCLQLGKKVYAYPTNITNCNKGTNYLIKQGASILTK